MALAEKPKDVDAEVRDQRLTIRQDVINKERLGLKFKLKDPKIEDQNLS